MHACAPFSYQVDFCIFIPIDQNTALPNVFYKINSAVKPPKLNILVHALLELSACYSSIPTSQSGKGSQLAKHLKHELRRASQNAPATAASDELEKSALAQRKYFNSFSSGS
jgi:hypothetical protein